ncbi:unnamed protein product [Onchocerca flexuosa]|uniref:Vacuolar protein sorting-associated protein 52 homolog n=1 Tax=Onchocerca flexuosa TaxID=387005 RepID=A0A183HV65_9BILA|nr:unnamed protein product [Onchocerca flexuosa]
MLRSFQSELGTISSDMKRLQQQSIDISQQLQNRQKIRGELSQFVDDMVVSQNMIQAIVERDVGDREFLEQLHELQHKLQFLKAQEFRDAKATSDVHDVIENLKYKAGHGEDKRVATFKNFIFQKAVDKLSNSTRSTS